MNLHTPEGPMLRLLAWLPRIVSVVATTLLLFTTLAVVVALAYEPEDGLGLQPGVGRPAQAVPDLGIVKLDAAPDVRPGGTLSYQVYYANAGQERAEDVVITDTLPPHTAHILDTASSQGWTRTISGTLVVWRRAALESDVSGHFDLVLRVANDAPAGTSLVNRAQIDSGSPEDVTNNNTSETEPSVVRVADVWVTKSGPSVVASGDRVTYTLDYGNNGSEAADDVVLTDTLPLGMTFVDWSSGSPAGIPAAPLVGEQDIVWSVGTLPASSTGRLTVTADVHPDQPSYSVLTNTVTIATRTPEQDLADDQATSAAEVSPGVPAQVEIFAPVTVTVDSSVVFTTEVDDRWGNPVADNTTVTFEADDLITADDSALTVQGTATATLSTGLHVGTATLTATAGSVDGVVAVDVVPGSVGDIRITATPGTQVVGDPVSLRAAVIDVYDNPVKAGVQVHFTSTLGVVEPSVGATNATGAVTVTLVATRPGIAVVRANIGSVNDATAVEFVPGPTAQVDVSADPAAINVDGATSQIEALLSDAYGNPVAQAVDVAFASSLGSLDPVTVTATGGRAASTLTSGPIHGTAAITATVGAYTGTTSVELLPSDLRITAVHVPTGNILPGTAVTYTMSFSNAGSALARDVVITDTLPVGLIDVAQSVTGAVISSTGETTYTWQAGDLATGEGGGIVLTGRFDPDRQWPASQLVGNIARIASATAEGNAADNLATSTNLMLTSDVYLEASLDSDGTDARPGGKLRYHLAFGNYNAVAAAGLTITATLPPYTTLWDWGELGPDPLGLSHLSDPDAPVQVWRYDGPVETSNFGEMYIWLNVAPNAPGGAVLEHEIVVGTDTPESDSENNRRLISARLEGVNLAVSLVGPQAVAPDHLVTYTLRYTNTGTVAADRVRLVDLVSPGLTLIDVVGPVTTPVVLEPGHVEWAQGTVLPGQFAQLVLIGRVEGAVAAHATVSHTASISTATEETYLEDNEAAVSTHVVADAPVSIGLDMQPVTVTVGTTTPVEVDVVDRFGNSIDGLTVALTATVGSITPTLLTTGGQEGGSATFLAPTTPAVGLIRATYGNLSAELGVEVTPGVPTQLTLSSSSDELPADGESMAIIRATVRDAFDNAVADGTQVAFSTDAGSLYEVGRTENTVGTLNGMAATTLIAPYIIEDPAPPSTSSAATVTATVDGGTEVLVRQVEISLLPVSAPPTYRLRLPLLRR